MEAECLTCAKATDRLPFVSAVERMCSVEHQLQSVLVGNGLQFVDGCGAAPQMDTDDAGGAWCDHAPHGIGIEIVRRWVDVREYRCDALPVECVGGGHERP